MDGIHVLDKFYPREVAYVSFTENDWTESYHLVPYLIEKNWKTVNFCKKYVHRLTFKSLPGNVTCFMLKIYWLLLKLCT